MSTGAAIAEAIEHARSDLDEIRGRVEDLLAERASVQSAPCDREEAERRIGELIDQAGTSDLFHRPEIFGAAPGPLSPFFRQRLRDEPLAAFAVIAPDALADALLEGHPGGGLSPDQREARLSELDCALLAAEIAEEIACREIEGSTGTILPRRLDANPAILLAPDREFEPQPEAEPNAETESADAGSTTKRRKPK